MEQHIIMPYMVIAVFIISALLSLLHGPFALPDVLFFGIITWISGLCQALIYFLIPSYAEEPLCVFLRRSFHLTLAYSLYLGLFSADEVYIPRVVALSPVGLRGHVGTIGFGEMPVNGSGGAGRRALFVWTEG